MTLTTCEIIWLCWLLADMSVYLKDLICLYIVTIKVLFILLATLFFMSEPNILK